MTFTIAAMPAYNESHVIAEVILGCKKHVDKVVVIDDGSSDNTAEIAQSLGAYVVRHIKNLGYGAALKSCFNTARELGADTMILIDSDGQHNPDEIPKLLGPLEQGFDLVIGSRFVNRNSKGVPSYRKAGMKVLDFATCLAGGIKVTDSQSGFRAYGKKAIEKIWFNGNDMSAGSEILLQAKSCNLRFTEVEIHCRYDLEDCSTQNPVVHGTSVLLQILKEMKYRKPLYYFSVPGVLIVTASLVMYFEIMQEFSHQEILVFGRLLLIILITVIGVLMIFSGVILQSMSRMISRAEH